MRVNLGSGDKPEPGWINLDLRGGDVIGDARRLPFADESVGELQALDLLEHFPETETGKVLGEWGRVLVEDGVLIVRVPNLTKIFQKLQSCPDQTRLLIRNLMGGHRWGDLDVHHWNFTPDLLDDELHRAGFRPFYNNLTLNMLCKARKV